MDDNIDREFDELLNNKFINDALINKIENAKKDAMNINNSIIRQSFIKYIKLEVSNTLQGISKTFNDELIDSEIKYSEKEVAEPILESKISAAFYISPLLKEEIMIDIIDKKLKYLEELSSVKLKIFIADGKMETLKNEIVELMNNNQISSENYDIFMDKIKKIQEKNIVGGYERRILGSGLVIWYSLKYIIYFIVAILILILILILIDSFLFYEQPNLKFELNTL